MLRGGCFGDSHHRDLIEGHGRDVGTVTDAEAKDRSDRWEATVGDSHRCRTQSGGARASGLRRGNLAEEIRAGNSRGQTGRFLVAGLVEAKDESPGKT